MGSLPEWRQCQIKEAASKLIENSVSGKQAVSLDQIINYNSWLCTTEREAKSQGVNPLDMDWGYVIYRPEKMPSYLIVYCDEVSLYIDWIKAHEIGHIVLGHMDGSCLTQFNANDEAECFAGELLALLGVISEPPPSSKE